MSISCLPSMRPRTAKAVMNSRTARSSSPGIGSPCRQLHSIGSPCRQLHSLMVPSTLPPRNALLHQYCKVVTPTASPSTGLRPYVPLVEHHEFIASPSQAMHQLAHDARSELSPARNVHELNWLQNFTDVRNELDALKTLGRGNAQQIEQLRHQLVSRDSLQLVQQLAKETDAVSQLASDISQIQHRLTCEVQAFEGRIEALEAAPWRSNVQEVQATIDEVSDQISYLVERMQNFPSVATSEHFSFSLENMVHNIEAHGNVICDRMTGCVTLMRDLAFVPSKAQDKAIARFRDPKAASEIIDDVVALAKLFESDTVTVEVRTAAEDERFRGLAEERASLVGQYLLARGLSPENVRTVGVAGKRGPTSCPAAKNGLSIRLSSRNTDFSFDGCR